MLESSFYITLVDTFKNSFIWLSQSLNWFVEPLTYIGSVAITPLLLITPIGLIAFLGVAVVRWFI